MAASSPALTSRPAPVSRSADWMVLGVALVALLLAWLLREQALSASEPVTVDGLQMALPAHSFPSGTDGQFAATTPDGLIVRVTPLPAPTTGGDDPLTLATARAITQGQALTLYRTVTTDVAAVGDRPAGVLEYMYVNADSGNFFSSVLEVVHGYELLVTRGDQLYVLSLEAPEAQWDEVQALWPRLVNSLRFEEVSQ